MVDDIVDGTAVCRSQYESPDVDGEILVAGAAGKVAVGDFVRVRVTGAEDYDLSAVLIS